MKRLMPGITNKTIVENVLTINEMVRKVRCTSYMMLDHSTY